jgi:hypothetical protein
MQDAEIETEYLLKSKDRRHGVTVVFPSRKPNAPAVFLFAGNMAAPRLAST